MPVGLRRYSFASVQFRPMQVPILGQNCALVEALGSGPLVVHTRDHDEVTHVWISSDG